MHTNFLNNVVEGEDANSVVITTIDAFTADTNDSDDWNHSSDCPDDELPLKVNPILHDLIPDSHELIQTVHHAVANWQ